MAFGYFHHQHPITSNCRCGTIRQALLQDVMISFANCRTRSCGRYLVISRSCDGLKRVYSESLS
jgi:hypothetical protein